MDPSVSVPAAVTSWFTVGLPEFEQGFPTVVQGPWACNSCLWYPQGVQFLSWEGQQQILMNEDLKEDTVEPQLQIERGSFEVPLHASEAGPAYLFVPGAARITSLCQPC